MAKSFKGRLVVAKKDSPKSWYSRGYFPHFDGASTQHVMFHLYDALPQAVLARWREELKALPEKEADLERRKRVQEFLDSGYGVCWLLNERLAGVVENALLHFDGERYSLHAWCVMPNHVHTLFTSKPEFTMSQISHSWKSFTAHECNKQLARTGQFWEHEPYDRYIRDERHYHNAVIYIENNPVKAGLCKKPEDWRWSSAWRGRDKT